MKRSIVHSTWGFDVEIFHEKQIEIWVDIVPKTPIPFNTFRVILLLEPPQILNINNQVVNCLNNKWCNVVLTHNEDLLKYENVYFFEYGTTWINNYEFKEKQFGVSTLIGGKTFANGHHLRLKLLQNLEQIKVQKNIYISTQYPPRVNYNRNITTPIGRGKNDKTKLFDTQFSIVIENEKRNNWFTEKLVDCLQTKTIPIYWGCPNINNWFNVDGFIIVNDLDDLIQKTNLIKEGDYEKNLSIIEENYEKSKEFINYEERVRNKVLSLLK